jgi:toxin YoeB
LIRDIERNPFSAIGKPEPLKHQLTGFWSRRIDRCHRLVYCIENETTLIAQCRDHFLTVDLQPEQSKRSIIINA